MGRRNDLGIVEGLEARVLFVAGAIDSTFGAFGGGVARGPEGVVIHALGVQPDGKIVAAGVSRGDFAVLRYNADGSLDPTFGGDGLVTTDFGGSDTAESITVQGDGKIVVGGTRSGSAMAVARYNPDGNPDPTFGGGRVIVSGTEPSSVRALALVPGGKILAGGELNGTAALVRLTDGGAVDTPFGSPETPGIVSGFFAAPSSLAALLLQTDGKIIAGGTETAPVQEALTFAQRFVQAPGPEPLQRFALARFNPEGTLDPAFAGDGTTGTAVRGQAATLRALAFAPAPGGSYDIVAAGDTAPGPGDGDLAVARFALDGSLDPTFGGEGVVAFDAATGRETAAGVVADTDGHIFVGGTGSREAAGRIEQVLELAQFSADGSRASASVDRVVTPGTLNESAAVANARAVLGDGRMVLGGSAGGTTSSRTALAARYLGDAPPFVPNGPFVSFDPSVGALTVIGSAGNDGIAVRREPATVTPFESGSSDQIVVTVNGQTQIFPASMVSTLGIAAGAGDDFIEIPTPLNLRPLPQSSAGRAGSRRAPRKPRRGQPAPANPAAANIQIGGGDGNDLIVVRADPSVSGDTFFIRGGSGNDTIDVTGVPAVVAGDDGDDMLIDPTHTAVFDGGAGNNRVIRGARAARRK